MKSKRLLLTLLLAILVPWAANAQQAIPYTEGFESMSSADDLTAAGWISSMSSSNSFLAIETGASNVHSGSKSLNIDSWNAASSDHVIVGLPVVAATINTLQITFSYKVTSTSVEVGYLTDANDASTFVSLESYSSSSSWTTKTKALDGAPDDAARIAIKYTGYYRCYVDDIEVKVKPTCDAPTSVTVDNITSTSADVTWVSDGSTWNLNYMALGDASWTEVNGLTSKSYSLASLNPGTTYSVRVQTVCADATITDWVNSDNFNTDCAALSTFPWSTDFDSYPGTTSGSTNNLPVCWNYYNGTDYSYYKGYPVVYGSSYTSGHSGKNSLYFSSYYSSSYTYTPLYAILPEMTGLNGKQLTLWAKASNANSSFTVGMMTDPNDVSTFTAIAGGTKSPSTSDYEECIFTLEAGSYVAIMMEAATSTESSHGIYIDDITIDNPPACAKPTGLEVAASGQTATLTWVSDASQWQVAHATSATDDPDANIVTTSPINTKTYSMENLDLDQDHYFWVRTYCSASEQSVWTGPVSVHIGYCVPAPTSVDNSGITNVTFGIGDDIVNNNTHPTSAPYYGDYHAQIGAVQQNVAATLSITYATGYDYDTYVWVDFDNSLSFEPSEVIAYGLSSSTNPTTLELTFTIPSSTSTGDYRMRIGGADSGLGSNPNSADPCYSGTYGIFEDYTLRVVAAPTCLTPENITITYTGGTTAEVSWTSTASAWNIDVNGTTTAITENPYTLTGLSLATNYDVKVQADCGGGDVSLWSSPKSFVTDLCMPEYQCLISYELSGGYEYYGTDYGWVGASISVVDVLTSVVLAEWTLPDGEATATGTLAVCDGRDIQFVWNPYAYASYYDDYCTFTISDAAGTLIYSGTEGFTTPYDYTVACPTCPKPLELAAVPTHTTAALTWTGADDTHTVEYQTAAYSEEFFFDGFENGFNDQGWTIYTEGEHIDGYEGWVLYADAAHSGDYGACAFSYYSSGDLDADNWLITPQVDLQGTLKFWEKAYGSSWPDQFEVLLSTTGKAIADFTTELRAMQASSASWNEVSIDLSSYSGQGYIAIHHVDNGQYAVFIDDFGIYGAEHPAGGWQTATTTAPAGAYNLESLTQGTKYDVRVTPNCGGPTSDVVTFSTMGANDKIFTTEGDWNVAANWEGGIPTNADNAYIRANVTIQNGVVATAKEVTIEGTPAPTLTIKEGGQLVHDNNGVTVTMEKTITGYTATQDHYYFLATPFTVNPSTVTGMLANEYDLYAFSFYETGEEWQNYKSGSFYLNDGEAYLYANNTTTTLAFTGEVTGSRDNWYWNSLDFENDATTYPYDGWNLIGNIYACNAYLVKENSTDVTSFYKINGNVLEASTGSIAPLEGVFVQTSTENTHVYYNRTAPSKSPSNLHIVMSEAITNRDAQGTTDNAIIGFNPIENLEKFLFNANQSNIYIPQDGKNYAVVNAENEGELPLNFKAQNDGSYTLSFSTENLELGYLHLIDKLTGTDTDLLATPSYSFEARKTDAANRFTLVFNANAVAEEAFAYISNGNIVVVNAEAGTTLQVVDMMGRVVVNTDAQRQVSTANIPVGVYVLRLINGNELKTQKIVVR